MAWKRIATVLIVAVMTWALSQDQSQTNSQQQPDPAQAQQQQAALRIGHFAVGGPTVQVFVDGEMRFDGLTAETLSEYLLLPAGEHQIELRLADGQQQQGQQDQQQNQDPQSQQEDQQQQDEQQNEQQQSEQQDQQQDQQQVQQGQVPDQVRQAVESAQQSVEQDAQQASGAVDEALQAVETAIQDAEAEALPTLEAIQASLTEAQEALQNDQADVAQDAVTQAMGLVEQGGQQMMAESEDGQQAGEQQTAEQQTDEQQASAQQQEGGQQALFSETVTLEAGRYYTVIASARAQTQDQIAAGGQAQQEGQQDGDAATQDAQGQQTVQPDDVQVRVIQDEVRAAPAGMALVRVVHAATDAPGLNLVMALSQESQQGQQTQQDSQQDPQSQQTQQEGEQTEQAQQTDQEQQAQDGQQDQQENAQTQEAQQTEQTGQASQSQDAQTGELTITIRPERTSNAVVSVIGPDGFRTDLAGGETLSNLQPGSYVVGATLESYQQAAATVDVQAGQTASVELTMERLPGAGPVPIAGQTFVPDLAPGTSSDYTPVPAGTYTAQLQAADRDMTAIELRGFDLQPGATYTLLVYGSMAQNSFNVTVAVDGLVPQGRDSRQSGQQQAQAQNTQDGNAQDQEAQQQDGEVAAGGQAEQEGQTADAEGEGGDMQAMQQQLQQSLDDARTSLENDDVDGARTALQEAQGFLQSMADAAEDAQRESLQQAQQGVQDALTALDDNNVEEARNALDQVSEDLQTSN